MALHSEQIAASSDQQPTVVTKHSIGASTAQKTLLEAKTRKGFHIFNHSPSVLCIDYGSSVSLNDFAVRIPPGGYYEPPFVTSLEIRGVWAGSNGKAFIREFN